MSRYIIYYLAKELKKLMPMISQCVSVLELKRGKRVTCDRKTVTEQRDMMSINWQFYSFSLYTTPSEDVRTKTNLALFSLLLNISAI